MGDENEVRVTLPDSSVIIDYASQWERDWSLKLAQARQAVAEPWCPPWAGLSEQERELTAVEARNWLRAGVNCGLILNPGET